MLLLLSPHCIVESDKDGSLVHRIEMLDRDRRALICNFQSLVAGRGWTAETVRRRPVRELRGDI